MDDFFIVLTFILILLACFYMQCHKVNMKHVDLMFTLSCSHLSPKLKHIGTS